MNKELESGWSTLANLDLLMDPKSIAIVGCSETNAGGVALRNLQENGYEGALYPVHPRHREVRGIPAFSNLGEIPAPVDCAILALRADLIPDALDSLHEHGVKAAVIFASGFSELGDAGQALQAEVVARLDKYGISACGPNCLGVLSFGSNVAMYYAGLDMAGKHGSIGFVSQSGSSCIAVTNAERTAGFSYVVSCGNEAGVSVADYVRFLADDDTTDVIGLHLETVRDAHALAAAAQYAEGRGKPTVVLKTGRSEIGKRAAMAHSGALASPHAIAEAFFSRNRIVLVQDLDELLETCELFVSLKGRSPAGPGVAITAVSGGMAGLAADVGSEVGVRFAELSEQTLASLCETLSSHSTPGNPLDVTLALHDTDSYRACLETLDQDPTVGVIAVLQGTEPGLNAQQRELYQPIVDMVSQVAKNSRAPILSFSPIVGGLQPALNATLTHAGVPHLMGTQASLRAIRNYIWWHHEAFGHRPEPTAGSTHVEPLTGSGPELSEAEGKELLKRYGIKVPDEHLVTTIEQAVDRAQEIGYPVVLKVDTPDIIHKTEAGIVRVGVGSDADVLAAFPELLDNASRHDPKARVNGVSVQEMVFDGFEMMLGVKNDPVFGPAILVAAGGIYSEVLADVVTRLAPLTHLEARSMIEELRCYPILRGMRGERAKDIGALAQAIVGLGKLAIDHAADIFELDVNPIVVLDSGEGAVALDALVITTANQTETRPAGHPGDRPNV